MTIRYEYKELVPAAYEAAAEAREVWMNVAQREAQTQVDSKAATRGYNLSIGIGKERLGFQSARIYTTATSEKWGNDPFWARFFEYGTLYIPAMPFIRPGANKGNKAWMAYMGGGLESKIRKRSWRRGRTR